MEGEILIDGIGEVHRKQLLLTENRLILVEVQKAKWNKHGTKSLNDFTFFLEMGRKIIRQSQECSYLRKSHDQLKTLDFNSDS